MQKNNQEIVLGIDPGTATVGYAFIKGTKQNLEILDYGVLKTDALPQDLMPQRLKEIGDDLEELIKNHRPTKAIVEDLFYFRNNTTIISVAQSRGVVLYLLAKYGVKYESRTPLQVKQTLCGYGRATKQQVQEMVKRIFKMNHKPKPDDAADALALAWMGI